MVIAFAGMTFAAVALLTTIYLIAERVGTRKLLGKHQREWDEIKNELIEKGFSQNEIDDEYVRYIEKLYIDRHSMLGACFPRE